MEVRLLPPERIEIEPVGAGATVCDPLVVRSPLRATGASVAAPLLVVALVAALGVPPAPGAPATRSPAAVRLAAIQHDLDAVTLPIRVLTSTWMTLVWTVHGRQADIRQASAAMRLTAKHGAATSASLRQIRARIRSDRRVLDRLLPGWLRIKAALHADYRRVKELLARSRAVVRQVLGPNPGAHAPDPWLAAWPRRISIQGALHVCPVAGPLSLTDSFGAPRPGGRIHEGNDLLSARGTPVLAVQSGVVIPVPNTLGGRAVILRSATGYSYYAHFSSYGQTGRVVAGVVIGYVGTSGDAKGLIPHVHYEWHPGGGPAVDPFPQLEVVCG